MSKLHRFRSISRMRKVSSGHLLSNDTFSSAQWDWSGQRRLWSDCAHAQTDQGLRCPHVAKALIRLFHTQSDLGLLCAHMPRDTFSYITVLRHALKRIQPQKIIQCLLVDSILLSYIHHQTWRFYESKNNFEINVTFAVHLKSYSEPVFTQIIGV